jgi:putative methyltransferase (TIGR04325 family)
MYAIPIETSAAIQGVKNTMTYRRRPNKCNERDSMSDAPIRAVADTLRDLHNYWSFHRANKNNCYRGVYKSYEEAVAALPPRQLQGFDHPSVGEFFASTHFVFNQSDYPVLFWLSQLLKPGQTLFDFGGGVGQCFYLYQKFFPLPARMRWHVCEIEAVGQRGQKVAAEKKAEGITFTTRFDEAAGAAVLLTSGALHYMEPELSELLAQLPDPPKHVLVNRVPMYDGETYYTVQRSQHSFLALKVMNVAGFVRGMERINYEKIDEWSLPRSLRIPFHPRRFVPNFRGFYFRRREL